MAKIAVVANYGKAVMQMRGPLLRFLREHGHEVVFCAPAEDPELPDKLGQIGVRFHRMDVDRTGVNPLGDLGYLLRLIRFMRRERPDKVLSFSSKPIIWAALAACFSKGAESYSVVTGLGYAFSGDSARQRMLSAVTKFLYRISVRFNKGIFFQNPDDAAMFRAASIVPRSGKEVLVGGSGVDVERFQPAPLPENPTFLLIARLVKEKGIYEYVEAARALKSRYPQAVFRLAGWFDSNPGSISQAEVERWVQEGTIEFLGFLPDVRGAIQEASVYVLPSYREGTPRTVLEAMAMGRPVITTDAPGCRETVQHGVNGLLVAPRDVTSLTEAMRAFIQNHQRAPDMGTQSRRLACEKYDVRMVNGRILQSLFDEVA